MGFLPATRRKVAQAHGTERNFIGGDRPEVDKLALPACMGKLRRLPGTPSWAVCSACSRGHCGPCRNQAARSSASRRVHCCIGRTNPATIYIVVLVGWVALRIVLEEGSRHILDFAVPGTFLGLEPAPGALMGHSAECLTEVTACLLPRVRFDRLVSRSITICSRLAELATAHEARAQDHLANLSGRDAYGRVAHLMAELFFRVQRKFPPLAGEVASLPLSLEHIGQATGLTAVHVSRILRALREERVLHFRRPRLEILDPAALLKAAGFAGQLASWCEGSLPPSIPLERSGHDCERRYQLAGTCHDVDRPDAPALLGSFLALGGLVRFSENVIRPPSPQSDDHPANSVDGA